MRRYGVLILIEDERAEFRDGMEKALDSLFPVGFVGGVPIPPIAFEALGQSVFEHYPEGGKLGGQDLARLGPDRPDAEPFHGPIEHAPHRSDFLAKRLDARGCEARAATSRSFERQFDARERVFRHADHRGESSRVEFVKSHLHHLTRHRVAAPASIITAA